MKLDESKVTETKYDHKRIKHSYKTNYNDVEIYAVKCRMIVNNLDTDKRKYYSWWCGYVELPKEMQKYFGGRILKDNTISLGTLGKDEEYKIAPVHGEYNYLGHGIPVVSNEDSRLFLGWEYDHCRGFKNCLTYQEILEEGMKVIDSMLAPKSIS